MCEVCTGRISLYDPDGLNITIKDNPGHCLAPSDWNMVNQFLSRRIDWQHYSEWYKKLVYQRYVTAPQPFLELLSRPRVVLLCYCTDYKLCHRRLAVAALKWIANENRLPFIEGGEIASHQMGLF